MSGKPEALKLAVELERFHGEYPTCTKAAAELRRLHTLLEAEQALHQRVTYPELRRLHAQRDALLALLKEARKIIRASSSRNLVKDWDQRTTAAIAKVEGEQT